ncbi:MAG: cupin domain-containing protein [Acidobacteria bacterium]|nr:cupin domain-containing protein [Acidobacteriota bacterium]
MLEIPHLEMHVAHGCNLRCEGCSHYSSQGLGGLVDLDEALAWMEAWRTRLRPRVFSLLGGEPTLHPRLPDFLEGARRLWPESHLRLVTNGWFLHRHPELGRWLGQDGRASLFLSVHDDSEAYQTALHPVWELLKEWESTHGLAWEAYRSFQVWTRRYHGNGGKVRPFQDGAPRASWEACPAKEFPQLHDGRIWKCGAVAYLGLMEARHGLEPSWGPSLTYQPLAPSCSQEDLAAFFAQEDEPCCGQCPAEPQRFRIPSPLPSATQEWDGDLQALGSLPPLVQPFPFLPPRDPGRDWQPLPLFRGPTAHLEDLRCHVSSLAPGACPHPPHAHEDEEILIPLQGEVVLVLAVGEEGRTVERLAAPGCVVYYPAGQAHTIRNPGPREAAYLMFRWRNGAPALTGGLPCTIVPHPVGPPLAFPSGATPLFHPLLDGSTGHLGRLGLHLTFLPPGGGYDSHEDPYDVAILTLKGEIETLGRRVPAHSAVFCPAGLPHGMRNPGADAAMYLVLEFHPHAGGPEARRPH